MDDVQAKIDQIVALVEGARSMPMSASCVVNRGELIGLLDEVRAMLPSEFRQAQYVLRDRDEVIDEGRREADRIIDEARAERIRMLEQTEIAREAKVQAEVIVTEAQERADSMRREVEDYVDRKLANFEVVLTKTLGAVERGREKLRGRVVDETLGEYDEPPLPELD